MLGLLCNGGEPPGPPTFTMVAPQSSSDGPPAKRSKPTISPPPAGPAPQGSLDTHMFPHLLDLIFDLADFGALLALRSVSHDLRARVDERLATRLVVRAPASKRTPGVYIYTLLPGSDDPLPLPAFAFYPFASDRPFTRARRYAEAAWSAAQAGREEFGDDHWAWNYAEADWAAAWGPWKGCASGNRALPGLRWALGGHSMDHSFEFRLAPAHGVVRRPQFARAIHAGHVARAYHWAARTCAAVRDLNIVGPVGREGKRLFQMRGVRSVRVAAGRLGEMVPKIPVPAPLVVVPILVSVAARTQAVPGLVEGVRTLAIHVEVGRRVPEPMVPFAHPRTLRDVVVVLRARDAEASSEEVANAPTSAPQGFGFLDAVLEHDIPRLDAVTHTIVGLDRHTAAAVLPCSVTRGQAVQERDEENAVIRDEFMRRLAVRVREKAVLAATSGRPWMEEHIRALLAGVRLLSLEEWEGRRATSEL